ncbi:MAG: DNA cytosine methyltransferase, partial [bacterium]|nr:DNA cytosine methyltransferase [bacterium]
MRQSSNAVRQTEGMEVGAAISLFSGAGGLDLGVEQAGFRTAVAVEWDDDAADTMEKTSSAFFPNLR